MAILVIVTEANSRGADGPLKEYDFPTLDEALEKFPEIVREWIQFDEDGISNQTVVTLHSDDIY